VLKYASFDIETTGLDPHRHQVLEIAVVVETDWKTPVEDLPFMRLALKHDEVVASWRALEMNVRLFQEKDEFEIRYPPDAAAHHVRLFQEKDEFEIRYPPDAAAHHVLTFLRDQFGSDVGHAARVTAAGKNFATFDKLFLDQLPGWPKGVFRHRVLDPVTLWLDQDDDAPPDMATCLDRANLKQTEAHTALGDARDVIRLIRAGLNYA
jgi:hypothetical protein